LERNRLRNRRSWIRCPEETKPVLEAKDLTQEDVVAVQVAEVARGAEAAQGAVVEAAAVDGAAPGRPAAVYARVADTGFPIGREIHVIRWPAPNVVCEW
jgi:hypothetical protein